MGKIIYPLLDQKPEDSYVAGLGYIRRHGENFLPAIQRLTEILEGEDFSDEDIREIENKISRNVK